jgi:hypothetical protein
MGFGEAHARRPALQPRRAERLGQRMGQVGVHGHTGDEGTAEAELPRNLVVVDLVLGR